MFTKCEPPKPEMKLATNEIQRQYMCYHKTVSLSMLSLYLLLGCLLLFTKHCFQGFVSLLRYMFPVLGNIFFKYLHRYLAVM